MTQNQYEPNFFKAQIGCFREKWFIVKDLFITGKGKGKGHPRTGHEGPEGE
jgi:hypothetical protein